MGYSLYIVGISWLHFADLRGPLLSAADEAMTAFTERESGTHILGIPGMTTGAVGIMTMLLGGIIIWYIRGMADRRRADNENVTSLSGAHDILFKNMQTEISRLSRLVTELSAEINALKRELHDERQSKLGAIRNAAQTDIAVSALLKGDDK